MTDSQHQAFRDEAKKHSLLQPIAHYIFLALDPVACLENGMKRGREEEVNLTLEYLQNVDSKHLEWQRRLSGDSFTVLSMDGVAQGSPEYEEVVRKVHSIVMK